MKGLTELVQWKLDVDSDVHVLLNKFGKILSLKDIPMRISLLTNRRRPAVVFNGREGVAMSPEAIEGPIPTGPLTALEREVIEWFVEFAGLLGVPASVGQIFGLLYLAGRALPFESFVERLEISKGSASQGLRLLRGLGVVRVVTVPGDRREFYWAETSPTKLVSAFLEEKVLPSLQASSARLDALEKKLAADAGGRAGDSVLPQRVDRLRKWNQAARRFLPVVVSLTNLRT
jgi:DNA-binding transcriptional regulator GbsR (MarR family)